MNFPWLVLGVMGIAGITVGAVRLTRQYAVCAMIGAGVILLLHGWFYFHYTSDDAYISYRYARNLADGAGLVWNPGQHVEGYTNFLWVMMLAGMDWIGFDIVESGRWLGYGLALIAMAEAYLLSTMLVGGRPGRWAGVATLLLLGASGVWAVWAFAGLESPLLSVLILAAILLHLRERDGLKPPLSGAVWALAAMTRPEAMALAVISGAFKAGESFVRVRAADDAGQKDVLLDELEHIVLWLFGLLIVYVPYFMWRYATYGWLYPNTYYAKVGSGFDQYERGLDYVTVFFREYAAWLLLLVPFALVAPVHRARVLYAMTLLIAWTMIVVYVGGDSLLRFRFFAPVMPLYYALICASAAALLTSFAEGRDRRVIEGAALAAGAALIAFTLQASGADYGLPPERQAVADRIAMGRWMGEHVPGGATIAVIPAGAMPYESRLTSIDMLGLNDEHIGHRDLPLGNLGAGHEKYDSEYVLDRQPDIIILTDDLSSRPWQREDYAGLNLGLIAARIDIVKQDRLWQEYEPRTVELEGKWFNMLVRRNAASVLAQTREAALP